MVIGIIIYIILMIVITGLLTLFHKRVTIPAGITVISILGIILSIIANPFDIPFVLIVPIFAIVGFCAFKYKFRILNFNKRILSLAPFKKASGGRVIGKCFPYYKKQLKYNHSTIVQSELAMQGGTIMTGSSGSGKTYGILNSIKQDIESGKSVVFFDFKGDTSILSDLENIAKGVPTYKLTWENCNFIYDPLINLDDNGRAEAILNMRKWSLDGSDAHYKTGAQLLLQKTIGEYNHTEGNYLVGYYQFLQKYNVPRELFEAYNTIIKLLELAITSKIGGIFNNEGNKFTFNQTQQYLLFVSFSSASRALGTSLTSLMLKDLMEVGTRSKYNPTLALYIDEFGSCDNTIIVKDILEKGRSCNIATTLSMQDLNQLIINTNAPFMDSVLGTVNSFIIYSGATRETANKLAGTQIFEIEELLMSLKKPDPINNTPPTAVYISKYPVFGKGGTEVYRFTPIKSVIIKNSSTHSAVAQQVYVPNIQAENNTQISNPTVQAYGQNSQPTSANTQQPAIPQITHSATQQNNIDGVGTPPSSAPSLNADDFL